MNRLTQNDINVAYYGYPDFKRHLIEAYKEIDRLEHMFDLRVKEEVKFILKQKYNEAHP
jgi:hypothetical protein